MLSPHKAVFNRAHSMKVKKNNEIKYSNKADGVKKTGRRVDA